MSVSHCLPLPLPLLFPLPLPLPLPCPRPPAPCFPLSLPLPLPTVPASAPPHCPLPLPTALCPWPLLPAASTVPPCCFDCPDHCSLPALGSLSWTLYFRSMTAKTGADCRPALRTAGTGHESTGRQMATDMYIYIYIYSLATNIHPSTGRRALGDKHWATNITILGRASTGHPSTRRQMATDMYIYIYRFAG